MCEQFKQDFVKKIEQIMKNDMVHKLKSHYGVIIKPCAFIGSDSCQEFYHSWNFAYAHGIHCTYCDRFLCSMCAYTKANSKKNACIDCALKAQTLEKVDIRMFKCRISPMCQDKKEYYDFRCLYNGTNFYCKTCHSLNSLVFI